MAKRRDTLDMDSVRIWDVDIPLHQKPLQPFTDKDDLLSKTIELFRRIDEDFADYVKRLNVMGLIDLADRANTGSFGGFSRAIGRHGNFIFLNVHRTREDVVNLIHEIGHAVSIYASCQLPYMAFWGFPYDFSETPSSVMEILSLPHWDVFYGDDELPIASSLYFYDLLRFSLVDCIQGKLEHWVYQYPEQSRDMATCDAKLLEFVEQFWAGIDWTGFDGMTGIDWQGRAVYAPLHTMEYVYGRMAGLKLLSMPEDEAIQHYQSAIRLGNSVTTRELFDAMGLSFPIDEPTVIETVSILSGRL